MSVTLRTSTGSAGEMDVRTGDLSLDVRGNWISVLELSAAPAAPSGEVEIHVVRERGPADIFKGFVRRAHLEDGTGVCRVVVVGGKGNLGVLELPPRDHVAGVAPVTAGLVARGIADAAGEVLAEGVEAALEQRPLERWTRVRGTGVEALEQLVAELGLTWRVLDDGTIWIGEESWPAGDVAVDRLDEVGDDGAIDAAPDGAQLRPGTVLFDRRIRRVTYRIEASALRAELLYAVNGDPPEHVESGVYAEVVAAEVVHQNDDGTLELRVHDDRIEGLSRVRLDVGLPGCKVTVEAKTEVRVAFEGQSPRGAFAFGITQDPEATHAFGLVGDSCGYLTAICAAPGSPAVLAISPVEVPNSVQIVVLGPGHKFAKGVRGT